MFSTSNENLDDTNHEVNNMRSSKKHSLIMFSRLLPALLYLLLSDFVINCPYCLVFTKVQGFIAVILTSASHTLLILREKLFEIILSQVY